MILYFQWECIDDDDIDAGYNIPGFTTCTNVYQIVPGANKYEKCDTP